MQRVRNAQELGALMREERKRRGYTQLELADFSGVGITFISQFENGKETAEIGKALHVLSMLGLNFFVDRRDS